MSFNQGKREDKWTGLQAEDNIFRICPLNFDFLVKFVILAMFAINNFLAFEDNTDSSSLLIIFYFLAAFITFIIDFTSMLIT